MSELADLLTEAFEQEARRPAQKALDGGIEAAAYWSFDPSVEVVLARADKTPADVPVDPPVAPAALYEFDHGWSLPGRLRRW